ncbi:MAG: hypothetical protein O9297_05980 [Flavobacterium sp.]|nr:hypothetical protein [Flavobacterium sp.]MCZ8296748.1 hypothetical protein [Flavobacterium sp.]
MTSEKLAEFRAKGMLLDPKFDRLAVIGDKRKENENDKIKTLSIKFISCSADDKNYNLTFEVSATNLKSNKAKIYVGENEVFGSEEAVTKSIEINQNGKKNIIVSFSKNKEFSATWFEGNFEFIAEITCDGVSAKTEEFSLKCIASVKDECKKEKVPALKLTEVEKLKFISTILCESQLGNESLYDIAWVYYNRVRLNGFDAWNGMKASSAYRLKQPDYKLCLYYFKIGNEYASVKYGNFTIKSYTETNVFKNTKEPKFLKLKKFIETNVFVKNPETCFKDWEGQGYWGDLDMNTDDPNNGGHDPKWFMARQYYWLQLQNKVKIKYVHIMRSGTGTSFIFHEKEIAKFFKSNPTLLPKEENVKKFNIKGILNFDL